MSSAIHYPASGRVCTHRWTVVTERARPTVPPAEPFVVGGSGTKFGESSGGSPGSGVGSRKSVVEARRFASDGPMDPTDDPQTPTRRAILGTTATLAALGLAGCSGDTGGGGGDGMITEEPTATPSPTPMPTEEPTMAPTETETERPTETESMAAPDVPILNYALTLEHLENAFYREGLETFTETELMESESLSAFGERVRMEVPEYLRTVGAHEAAHVSAIADTVEEAEYDFGYETPSEFLGVAKALENTGVAAYKGAAPSVSNDAVFAAALGIHSVEARHAALLNELNTDSPFPSAVDEPMSMDEVVEIADGFIVESGS
jgi:hypothetical protein